MEWYIPLLIFVARIGDVSVGTLRTVLVISGHKYVSAILGFIEVVIWVLAVGGTLKYLPNPFAVVAFAGGYACGILVGMGIENKLALGLRMIRVINPDQSVNVSAALREHGYRATRLEGTGQRGPVEIAFSVIRRRKLAEVRKIIQDVAPECFVSVERVDRAESPDFIQTRWSRPGWFTRATAMRK